MKCNIPGSSGHGKVPNDCSDGASAVRQMEGLQPKGNVKAEDLDHGPVKRRSWWAGTKT